MREKINAIINSNGYNLRVTDYFSEGWALIKPHLGVFIGFAFLGIVASLLLSFIPGAGVVISPILSGGMFMALREADKGNDVSFETFFKIFQGTYFAQLLGGSLVSSIFILLGIICLILPGIYLAIAYSFIVPLILFSHTTDFWENMETSRKIISKNWWGFFGLLFLVGVLMIFLTIFTIGLGIFIAIPWSSAIMYCAYRDVVGFESQEKQKDIMDHLV
jgi:hypothetical protein